uniref:Uncharacterized protein n=1 Tax=Eptatretus burgeri TaxID=7764 RepID=A0A8C4QM88_EPTBU
MATTAFTLLLLCLTLPSTSAEGRMDHPAACESALDKIGSISTISLKAPSSMYYLDLSYNNLTDLPSFQFLDKLTILKLNNNNLSFLADGAFSELPNIIELHLKNNNIRLLHDTVFHNLPSLTHIHLGNNYLSSLPLSLLEDQTDFEVLDISNNLLRIIPPGFFSNVNIMYLYAFGNFWKCDCSALYFAEWILDWGTAHGCKAGQVVETQFRVPSPISYMPAKCTFGYQSLAATNTMEGKPIYRSIVFILPVTCLATKVLHFVSWMEKVVLGFQNEL